MIMMIIGGCNKGEDELKGILNFGLDSGIESALKSLNSSPDGVTAALITVVDSDGNLILEKEQLEFYRFGEAYVTTSVSLEVGNYQLTEFFLVDSTGSVLWATPVEGSPLASLVNDPVPIDFMIDANRTTHVIPEVVWVGSHNPSDFGYVDFIVDFVERFCVAIHYESPCMDWYSDSLIDPIWPAPAILEVTTPDGKLVRTHLLPGLNKVQLPRGHYRYHFRVSDCGGICFRKSFYATELIPFSCATGKPMFIVCEPAPSGIIITPEEIKEPTIIQGVFGQVARMGYETDEFIPLVRDIYFYHYPPDDSLNFILDNANCYLQNEIPYRPEGIVRSNTSGYYQIPLEAGRYLYMVETNSGFYIDMYISAHPPGEVVVKENEVSIRNIIIYPCN
jgi:hypothetical protein